MTAFDWIAIVGAAAWVPQVLGWAARHLVTPRLRVIPVRAPEIGYTSLGPIFNLPCAISAERKDAVIERVSATITHQNGQSTSFRWTTLNETLSQLRNQEGLTEVGKNQTAVALKVSTLVLTEKQIGMQERSFEEDSRQLMTALGDEQDHLKNIEPVAYPQLTLKSKQFGDLIAFANKRFVWQEGRYSVRLELRLVGVKNPTVQMFSFTLNALEVNRLRQNLEEIERYVRELIQPPLEGQASPYRWNWAYPPLEQSDLPVRAIR
jgi:hypothetical protein